MTNVVEKMQGVTVHKIGPSVVVGGPSLQKRMKDVGAMGKEATKVLQAENTDVIAPFEGQTPGKSILVGVVSMKIGDGESPGGGAHKVHVFGGHGGVGVGGEPRIGVDVGRKTADRQRLGKYPFPGNGQLLDGKNLLPEVTVGVRDRGATCFGLRGAIDLSIGNGAKVLVIEDEAKIKGAGTNDNWDRVVAGVPKVVKGSRSSLASKEDHGFRLTRLEVEKSPKGMETGDDCGGGKFGPFQSILRSGRGQ